jgi:hypothetical protein
MATDVESSHVVELLTRLLARRTDPGHGHVVLSEAEYEDNLRQLLDMTGEVDEVRRTAMTRLRNQLVHTEVSTSTAWRLGALLADSKPQLRQEAAMAWAEAAAASLAQESSRWRSQYEGLVTEVRKRSDDNVGLAVAASVADSFLEHLAAVASGLGNLETEEAVRLGRRAAEQVLAAASWSQIVGDRLDTTQVARLLGVTRQALAKRQTTGSLLGLPGDRTTWYPTWQFDIDAARIRPEVRDLIGAFRDRLDDVDPLVIAAWATTSQDEDLAGDAPVQWLRAGRDPDQLRQAAERAAARLAR